MLKVKESSMNLDDTHASDVVSQVQSAMENRISSVDTAQTAKPWLMYVHMISLLQSLIQLAPTDNCKLYLQSLHEIVMTGMSMCAFLYWLQVLHSSKQRPEQHGYGIAELYPCSTNSKSENNGLVTHCSAIIGCIQSATNTLQSHAWYSWFVQFINKQFQINSSLFSSIWV